MSYLYRHRNFFRLGTSILSAALIAGCSSAAGSLPNTNPAGSATTSLLNAATRTIASESASEQGDHGDAHRIPSLTASVASLSFASPTSAFQTLTFTTSGRGESAVHLDVDLSASGIVSIRRVRPNDGEPRDAEHGDGMEHQGRSNTVTYTITPLAAGQTTIIASLGKSTTLSIPVTVGTGIVVPPLSVTASSPTINCTVLTCGQSGIAPIGPFVAKLFLPTDTLSITSTIASPSYVVTSVDGNCGIVGATSPATVVATSPATVVTIGITSSAYTAARTSVSGIGVVTIPYAFSVADTQGNTVNAAVSYILPFPI